MTEEAVDLFAGAGGASLGLKRADYNVVGFDYWEPAVRTHNHNGMPAHVHDLSDPTLDALIPSCDVMWLSPPCQSFSAAGSHGGAGDKRNGFPWALRVVGLRRPRLAVFENVRGLTFSKNRPYLDSVCDELRSFGYAVDWRVLNCADYGVPQTRQRCFIIARLDGQPCFPEPTHAKSDWITMASALGWGADSTPFPTVATGHLDAAGVGGSGARSRLYAERDSGRWILDYRQTDGRRGDPIMKDVTDTPAPTVGTQSGSQWEVHRWAYDRPAMTVQGTDRIAKPGHKGVINRQFDDCIKVSVEELAILQGFPPEFEFLGTKTQRATQVGNAVPPIIAELLVSANRRSAEA